MPAIAATALALSGCQSGGQPSVSLEEAKEVTAAFEGQSFVPPPRTIDDVTAILDLQKLENVEAYEAERRLADSAPAPGLGRGALAAFYRERGKAADLLGRIRQGVDDYANALGLADGFTARDRAQLLQLYGMMQFRAGRSADGIRSMEEAIEILGGPEEAVGRTIRESILSGMLAYAGDLAGAEARLAAARADLDQIRYGSSSSRAWERMAQNLLAVYGIAQAEVAEAAGLYGDGEAFRRSSLEARLHPDFQQFGAAPSADFWQSLLGENLLKQERYVEAEAVLREALTTALKRSGRYQTLVSRHLWLLSEAMLGQERFADAEALAKAALEVSQKIGAASSSNYVIRPRAALGGALAAQGRWQAAAAQLSAIADSGAGEEVGVNLSGIGADTALALVKTGRAAEAVTMARAALAHNRERLGENHIRTATVRGIYAMALTANGETAMAREAFAASLPILTQRSRRSDDESTASRGWRLKLILESYLDLLGTEGDGNAAAEAFRVAALARGQSVQQALSASAARASARNPGLADLARREQDALKQIGALNALYANAVSVPTDQQNAAAIRELRKRLDALRGARAALAEEIERRFPDYAALINPKPAAVAEAQAALQLGEALIATYVGDDKSFVWAVPKSGAVSFAVVPLGRARLAGAVADLRRALDPRATRLGDIPPFDMRLAHRLYRALLAPVAAGWKNAESLIVVAHGPLGQLPFQVLVTEETALPEERAPLFANYRGGPFLVQRHAVTVVPSAASLATLRRLPPAAVGRRGFAGFGDPVFARGQVGAASVRTASAMTARGLIAVRGLPVALRAAPSLDDERSADLSKLPRLPDTAEEVRGIALALKADLANDVFTGTAATEGRVKQMTLSGYKVLAFATHGLVPGDLDGLTQPALALSAPSVVGGSEDGLLTMGEILGLRLDADWVVLSACNTAAGRGAGAEAVSGLGRAFFYAGTRALLVSNWPVETTSARALTTDIFARQAADPALSRGEALRRAMLALIEEGGLQGPDGRMIFSYAHPIFWAPFSLIGDGGGQAKGGT